MWIRNQSSAALLSGLLLAICLFLAGCGGQPEPIDFSTLPPDSLSRAASTKGGDPILTSAPTSTLSPASSLAGRPVDTEESLPASTLSPEIPAAQSSTSASATTIPADQPKSTTARDLAIATVIGHSAEGRPIVSYRLGQGSTHLVLVGGIHGGYEWNTILLAYRILDYFLTNPEDVPQPVSLYIIPSANPDGQYTVTNKIGRFTWRDVISNTVPGRFNSSGVDLNRNWDCLWQPTGLWQGRQVSGGERPFSEPESQALSRFLLELQPAAVLFFHSEAEGVYAAGCPETDLASYELSVVYGLAAGYPIYGPFQYYPVTGDAGSWLVTQGIPSITVELTTHEDLDWLQNLRGMLALLATYEAPRAEPFVPVR